MDTSLTHVRIGVQTVPELKYIAHSAFTITHEETVVAVDPFITGNPLATVAAAQISPTVILITHAHNDHVGDALEMSKRTGAPIITIFELGEYLGWQGATTIAANHGGTVAFEGGTVKLVPAWHSSGYEAFSQHSVAPGVPAGLIVTIGEKKIYFAGDTCLFLDMQLIGEEELDVAVLPIGDLYTMGPADAVRAARFLRAKHVIPCHYNTFPPIEQDPLAFKKEVDEKTDSTCIVLSPGESWTVE